ncbi:phage tail domain-containing protein [Metabacillus dongyingensis]|uniref:phage tail domain-containing protein n=1 Tax=Metabacillus dongyingensis TaxID=2874282 RepID=UPI003B8B386B
MIVTPHNFKIKLKDGQIYDMANDLGIIVNSFIPEYPEFTTAYQERPKHGLLDYGSRYDQRNIKTRMTIVGTNQNETEVSRQYLFSVLNTLESFEIYADKSPGKVYSNCKLASPIKYTEESGATFTLDLDFIDSNPFVLSIYDTLTPMSDTDKWPVGMGIDLSLNPTYIHSVNTFSIYNFGHEEINPRIDDLLIEYKGAASNPLVIENISTGDKFQYNGTVGSTTSIKLDKLRVTKSGLSVYGNTNRKAINLRKGENKFNLTGTTNPFTIEFKFRLKYLA